MKISLPEGSGPDGRMWLGAIEGYYGPPLAPEERLDLVRWLGDHGYNSYAYGPKDDPYHRDRWREPYPDEDADHFRDLVTTGERAGITVVIGISPGLDWRDGDETVLIRKIESFRSLGATAFGVAWDDVPPGGEDLGARHAAAVTTAVESVGEGAFWMSVPTDYATPHATSYLRAFAAGLPEFVEVAWTGPSIVSPKCTGQDARAIAGQLGRKMLFGENFPVNDATMSGVLHLGPYPDRTPDLVEEVTGVFCNFMAMPEASRIGLGVAARFWADPAGDREKAWEEVLAEFPGVEPIARACRSWVGDSGPDRELAAWADSGDERLWAYLGAGCRNGLDSGLSAEIEPWLEQWDKETQAMQAALQVLSAPLPVPAELTFLLGALWDRCKHGREQLFGMRWALYPVTTRIGDILVVTEDALVKGSNLTDQLCQRALGRR